MVGQLLTAEHDGISGGDGGVGGSVGVSFAGVDAEGSLLRLLAGVEATADKLDVADILSSLALGDPEAHGLRLLRRLLAMEAEQQQQAQLGGGGGNRAAVVTASWGSTHTVASLACYKFATDVARPWLRAVLGAPLRALLTSSPRAPAPGDEGAGRSPFSLGLGVGVSLQISRGQLRGSQRACADPRTGDPDALAAVLAGNRQALAYWAGRIFQSLLGDKDGDGAMGVGGGVGAAGVGGGSLASLPLALRRLLHCIATMSPPRPASSRRGGAGAGGGDDALGRAARASGFLIGRVLCAAIIDPVAAGVFDLEEDDRNGSLVRAQLQHPNPAHASHVRDNLGVLAKLLRQACVDVGGGGGQAVQPRRTPDNECIHVCAEHYAERLRAWVEAAIEIGASPGCACPLDRHILPGGGEGGGA
jgi:hypothetical protein